jgi:hypothetical protein
MDAVAQALLEGEPRFVSEFLFLLSVALKAEFNVDEIGRGDKPYLMGVYIGPQNKRHLVLYVGIGRARHQITRIVRVDYTMPVPAEGAPLFGGPAGQVMPAAGPIYRYFGEHNVEGFVDVDAAIAADVAAAAARGGRDAIQPWDAEIARLVAAQTADRAELARLGADAAGADESPEVTRLRGRLRTLHNALHYWREIQPIVLMQIDRAGILAPGAASPRSPAPRPLRRYQLRRVTPNVEPLVASRSSERARITRRRGRRGAGAVASRSNHSRRRGRGPRRMPVHPITGKPYRRRQPYSDPRATSTDETDSPSPMMRGHRSGYEGNSNSTRRTSTPPPIRSDNRGSISPNVF